MIARIEEIGLNVVEQVYSLGKTSTVQNAWKCGARPFIHGWVFDLHSGYIRPQRGMINNDAAMREVCEFHHGVAS
jgi:carbonic anhydrase